MNVFEFKDEIMEISTHATQEHLLAQQLQSIETSWAGVELTLKQYKDSPDILMLTDVEEIVVALDESLSHTNNILASRFIKPLRKRGEKMLSNLMFIQETIDKWLECQRKWLYLENIFVTPEIKKQLPTEAVNFEFCDKFMKTFTKKVSMQPKVMRLLKSPDLLENLTKISESLDNIEHKLEDYLEIKRGIFPRFYFLSNDELIEILSKSKEIAVIQLHLKKCFENIYKIIISSDGITITHMISAEGEKIPFKKPSLQARGNIEDWLMSLQRAMFEIVQKSIRTGMTEFANMSRNEFILQFPAQVGS